MRTSGTTSGRARSKRALARKLAPCLVAAAIAMSFNVEAGLANPAVPYAAGDSSGNIQLNSSERWIMNRWVARRTGTVVALHLRTRIEGSACWPGPALAGYAKGSGGSWLVTTHPVLADGEPDLSRTLAGSEVSPCGDSVGDSIAIPLDLDVEAGQEFATVVRNSDPAPETHWASQNFLYLERGLVGANARNERSADADDGFYGLDPREAVGFSRDGGQTWSIPGGPYGVNGGAAFLPTYLQEYTDGDALGQPFYSSTPWSGPVTMVYPGVDKPWTISQLGAYASGTGSAEVSLLVDGTLVAKATLSGGGVLRAPIEPVLVSPGQKVEVSVIAGANGLPLRIGYAGAVWTSLAGLGLEHEFQLQPRPEFVSPMGPAYAAPVYPLPAPGAGVPAEPETDLPGPELIVRNGRARFELACPAEAGNHCRGRLSLTRPSGAGHRLAEARSFRVASGRQVRTSLRLDALARALISGGSGLTATTEARWRDSPRSKSRLSRSSIRLVDGGSAGQRRLALPLRLRG